MLDMLKAKAGISLRSNRAGYDGEALISFTLDRLCPSSGSLDIGKDTSELEADKQMVDSMPINAVVCELGSFTITSAKEATEEIPNQITAIQTATSDAVAAIQKIATVIEESREISTSIASAIEEQGAAIQEIARNVQEAAAGTQEVSSNISGVTEAANETGNSANQMLESSEELSKQAENLTQKVDDFLKEIRAMLLPPLHGTGGTTGPKKCRPSFENTVKWLEL